MPQIKTAWHYLATLNADLPWVCVWASIFLIVYAVRKKAPSLWMRFEALSPVKFPSESAMQALAHKAFQALPSLLLGGVMTFLGTGSWTKAAVGVLAGAVPPIMHEFAAWLPLLSYKGKLGTPKPKAPKGPPDDPDTTISLMPEPVKLVAQDRSRLHNDAPDEPTECRRWMRPSLASGFVVALLLVGCGGSHIDWPRVAACAEPLEQPLLQTVASVLAGTGDVKSELEQIALTKGAGVVECAVQQIVSDIGSEPVTARATHTAARGRAFLESVQR